MGECNRTARLLLSGVVGEETVLSPLRGTMKPEVEGGERVAVHDFMTRRQEFSILVTL